MPFITNYAPYGRRRYSDFTNIVFILTWYHYINFNRLYIRVRFSQVIRLAIPLAPSLQHCLPLTIRDRTKLSFLLQPMKSLLVRRLKDDLVLKAMANYATSMEIVLPFKFPTGKFPFNVGISRESNICAF